MSAQRFCQPTVLTSRLLAIRCGNQIGGARKNAEHCLDERPCSEPHNQTGWTSWTKRMGLRSRWRRFESCRGRQKPKISERTFSRVGGEEIHFQRRWTALTITDALQVDPPSDHALRCIGRAKLVSSDTNDLHARLGDGPRESAVANSPPNTDLALPGLKVG
jgi:hypothetical protein